MGYLGRNVFVFQINTDAGEQEIVSLTDPRKAFDQGLSTEAILGALRPDGDGITPERFQENPAFVRYLHGLIAARIHEVGGVRASAQQQGDGYVYLIDARTPEPTGKVPPVDIIGAVKVEAGAPVADSYQPNPNHRLLTEHGFFKLAPELETALQTDLENTGRNG